MKKSPESDPSVLYLDADTEITEAIEKLKKATDDEVRVVVPSRSGLLQSSVNVKLLKKAAKDSKKELVLVTNDKLTKNLAGASAIAVASSVKAMAHVPEAHAQANKLPENIQISEPEEPETAPQPDKSNSGDSGFEPKHISLDADGDESEVSKKSTQQEKPKKVPKDKKVPNYGKLNKRIWWIAGGVALIIGLIMAAIFVPTGKVTVLAKAKKTNLNFNFILDATATSSDPSAQTLAAQKLEATKDVAFEITATGKKEVGTKATGTISVRNCDDVATHSLPAGSGVTGGGKSFVTAQAVTIPAGSAGGGVVNCSSPIDVQISAAASGESFNVGPTNFALNGFSALYKATGQTSGGTSKTITVLSAEDVANAKKQVEQQGVAAKDELSKKAGDNMMLFTETVQADIVQFNTSVQQDNEADRVAVTAKARYSGFAAKNDDVNKLFEQQIQDELKGNKQIYQNGAKEGKYSVVKQFTPQKVQLNVKTSAFYGDPIDTGQIAKDVAGKPKKEVADIVKKQGEQITGASVETWPEFIPNMPLLSGKIKVEIKVTTD